MDELALINKMLANNEYVKTNYRQLQQKHPNEYVAVDNGRMIDSDKNIKTLTKRLSAVKNKRSVLVEFIPISGMTVLY